MSKAFSVIAVLTSFNRREQTVLALQRYLAQKGDFDLSAVLMDDGSTDGTAEQVQSELPEVSLLQGDGSLYWNGGMTAAYNKALERGADYYLWLNDDTHLNEDALSRLIVDAEEAKSSNGCIVVGSTKDPVSGEFTYGGLRSDSTWHAGKFALVQPGHDVQPCDAMNGNIVLISRQASETIGGIDERFTHSMGDYDYALRGNRNGVAVVIGRGFHGECQRNPIGSAWTEQPSIGARYRKVNSPKGLPMREWAHFLKKHGSITWPLAWLATYRRIITG